MIYDMSSSLVGTNFLSSIMLLYTDPGTGTLILQLLAAGFIGAAFYARQFARRAKSLFSKTDGGADNASSGAAKADGSSSDLAKKAE